VCFRSYRISILFYISLSSLSEIHCTYVIVSLLLLVAVIFFGHEEHNAQRSMSILGMNIQPSEFVKLTLIIYLASVYSKKQKYINNFVRGVLPPLVVTVGMVGLIIMQPDIGTSSIILLVVATIIIS